MEILLLETFPGLNCQALRINSHVDFLDTVDNLFQFQHVCPTNKLMKRLAYQEMISNLSCLPPLGNTDHICIEYTTESHSLYIRTSYDEKLCEILYAAGYHH